MNSSKEKKPASRPSGGGPAIRTLADLNRRSSDAGSGSDSDEMQEYYTGGEKSGMLVQDPNRGNQDVDAIFDQARQMGAQQGPFEEQSSISRNFTGTGRLLSGQTVPSSSKPPENVVHNICFWSNGFTVDDRPLRRFDDPANALFLESIKKSECPKELEPEDKRSVVHVNLSRRDETFPEPVKLPTSFQGIGRTLGSTRAGDGGFSGELKAAPTPFSGLFVDENLPLTSIQIRLADGTRLVSRFNLVHTVGDIRAFIDASRSGSSRNYILQTVGFPPKQLFDGAETVEQAGLTNSVVVQKF